MIVRFVSNRVLGALCIAGVLLPLSPAVGDAPVTPKPISPTEKELLATIEKLGGSLQTEMPLAVRLQMNAGQLNEIVTLADEFIARFPQSADRDRVLIAKIAALSELARARPEYLDQLLSVTAEVASKSPGEPLASENAFYAIHAFVIGARAEKMDSERRLLGTMERYRAFLKDHPNSRWTPIVWASLVRNLLVQKKPADAMREVERLEKAFPEHRAAKRARGELFRLTAIGKPFGFILKSPDGRTLNTNEFAGKVLVLHFWANTNAPAMEGLTTLRNLHQSYGAKGLALVGINLDNDAAIYQQSLARLKLPWPQHHEPQGLVSDLVISLGVIRIPTYYVIDHKGLLRHTNPGAKLPQVVKDMIQKISN